MAFPGTYNINYYQGDLYEFNIYPKDSTGATFNISDYSVAFTISTTRPAGSTAYEGIAIISNNIVSCKIPGGIGKQLTPGTTYQYDVQIRKSGTSINDPDRIYTLLSGQITVTADVTRMVGD
jgi:hypothetical protein